MAIFTGRLGLILIELMLILMILRQRPFGVIRIRISDPRSVWIMYIKRAGESTLVMDSPVPLMRHHPDRSWITDPDPDHPK